MRAPGIDRMRRNAVPTAVFQCLPGNPTAQVNQASQAIAGLLAANGAPTKIFGVPTPANPERIALQDLPAHRDYVLLLHDSGNETEEEYIHLAGLAAPIILLHHTQADKARHSLDRWAMARAAMGLDPIATVNLRSAGFHDAGNLLLPAPAFKRRKIRGRTGLRLVVPGDLTSHSHARTIIGAFARLRQSLDQPSHLTFLGRTLDAAAAKATQDEIHIHGLQDIVTITGTQHRSAEIKILAESDLCLLLTTSQLLPEWVVQTACSGVPILAQAVPPVVYTLGHAGLNWSVAPTVEQLAERLIELATYPERLKALGESQQSHLEATRSDVQVRETLWNALGRCGFAFPVPPAERQLIEGQLGFVIAGHFEGSYSIAAVNRLLAAALERRRPGSTRIVPVAFSQPIGVLDGIPADQAEILTEAFLRETPNGTPVVAITQHFPPWKPDFPNDLALSLFTWEETLVPPAMVEMINSSFAGVIVVSRFVAKSLIDSGVRLPVGVVGQSLDTAPYIAVAKARASKARPSDSAPFTVLHVSSCFPRKGPDVLLTAWAEAFNTEDQVRLIIKTFPNPHQRIAEDIERLRADFPALAPIELIEGDLAPKELVALYRAADCMALPTRGEGFNMVAAEAILADLPLIVTDFGGHLDFIEHANVRRVQFRLAASASHVAGNGALWAEPDRDDLIAALREAFAAQRSGRRFKAARGSYAAREIQLGTAAWTDRVVDFSAGLIFQPPPPLKRIAWISSWAVRCGIAEYSKSLLDHRPGSALSSEIMLLCDTRTSNAINMHALEAVSVVPAWRLGQRQIAADVETHLRGFDPQILVIQHQDGLVSWEDLLDLIYLARKTNIRLVIFLHSTEAIPNLYHKLQASTIFGLALADRVIVHTLHDIENLRAIGLTDNVTLSPHGAAGRMAARPAASPAGKIIGCYGFFLPHKGIAKLIEAFAALRADLPSARLRLVNAAFPSELSQREIKSCRALAQRLQVDDAVDWHTDYLDDSASTALLSSCEFIVLPYDQTPESVSGAVRHALASGRPVAVSDSPIFTELGGAVHHVDASDADRLTKSLQVLLNDPVLCHSTQDAATNWLAAHDWTNVAKRLFNMMEGLNQMAADNSMGRLVLAGSNRLLETVIGRPSGGNMVYSGGEAGFGIYGPYLNLIAGDYKIIYRFDPHTDLIGTARFEAYSQIAAISITLRDRVFAKVTPDHYTTELHFNLSHAVPEVEFRMYCEAGFQGALQSLSIQLLKLTT